MKSSPNASPPKTLALLADRFDEPYQQAILRTMEEAANQRGISLLAVAGGIPGSTLRSSDRRSLMFELVTPDTVDGVILLAGTMVNKLGIDALEALLKRVVGLPVCAIGVEVPGVSSVLVDNEAGIDQAMHHLVSHHGVKRIACIRGPAKNLEAEARFRAYRTALEKAGAGFDPELVLEGDFLRHSGEAAIQYWLQSKAELDAVICANDEMALGAISALIKAGVKVPDDVKVVGFDGVECARLSNPPLTTVRQPLDDLAISGVRTVMDQIQGRSSPAVQMLQTHLVVRESCGCEMRLTSTGQSQCGEEGSGPDSGPRVLAQEDFLASFQRFRQPLQAELARVARGEFAGLRDWDQTLIAAFSSQIDEHNAAFIQALTQLVSKLANTNGDVGRFQDVITAFRRFALPCCGEDHTLRKRMENVLQEARLLVAHAAERVQTQRYLDVEYFGHTLTGVAAALTSTFDLGSLAKVAPGELPKLGVSAFYLVCYEPFDGAQESDALPPRSRLIAAFDTTTDLRKDVPDGSDFATTSLLPASLSESARTHQMAVMPLFWKDRNLGYFLVECRGGKAWVIEVLRDQLSIALFGALLSTRAGKTT